MNKKKIDKEQIYQKNIYIYACSIIIDAQSDVNPIWAYTEKKPIQKINKTRKKLLNSMILTQVATIEQH